MPPILLVAALVTPMVSLVFLNAYVPQN